MDPSSEPREPKRRYRHNADDSQPSFFNSVSPSVTPENLSESLTEVAGNPMATAAEGSDANKKLTLVAVGVLFFIVFVILLMRYGYPKPSRDTVPSHSICNLEPCLDYSGILRASISDAVNPCNNFYAYVCHGFQWRGKGASILSLTRQRLIDAVLDEWLHNDSAPEQQRRPNKSVWAGRLLQMCVDQHESGARSIAELQRFMAEMNLTWPDAGVNSASRDTLGTLVQMSLRWHVDVWFSLRVGHVNSSTRRPTFQLLRSGSYLEWEGKRRLLSKNDTYGQILALFLSVFGVNETAHGKSIADRLHTLEEEISSVLAASINNSRSRRFVVLPIKGMAPNVSGTHAFEWTAAIAKAFGAAGSEFANDTAVVESMNFLQSLNKLLQIDADRSNAYAVAVGWSVARDLASFFHADLSRKLGMTSRNAAERCLNRIDEVTKPALTLSLFRRTLPDELLLRVRRMFHAVQDVAIEELDSNLWMDSGTKRRALFSARRIALVTRLPRESDLRHEGGHSVPHLDDSRSFFQAWRTAMEHMQEHLLEPRGGSPAELAFLGTRTSFDPESNHVVLHPASLGPPLFASALPAAVKFAGLGQLLARELMRGFHAALSRDIADVRDASDQWRPETFHEYKERMACFLRSYESYGPRRDRAPAADLERERFSDFASAPALFDAFRRHQRNDGSAASSLDERLPGLEAMEASKLFFLAYCLTLCAADDDEEDGHGQNWAATTGPHLEGLIHPEQRCNVPFMHMQQFANAFSCSQDDDMNPHKKCSLW